MMPSLGSAQFYSWHLRSAAWLTCALVLLPADASWQRNSDTGMAIHRHYQQNDTQDVWHLTKVDLVGKHQESSVPVVRQERFKSFGHPHYWDFHPSPTWQDMVGTGNPLGAICNPEEPQDACGSKLVCNRGVCRHCRENRECPSFHVCAKVFSGANMCVPEQRKVWVRAFTDVGEFLCSILIFFSSAMAAAAGTGGGGMFVPLLMALSGLKPEYAVPLSQCMILCGSIVNLLVFVAQRHPTFMTQAVIDYDCVVLLEPMLCLGVTIGVLLNRMSPQWFLLLLLSLTLGMALWRTGTKGLKQLKQERVLAGDTTPEIAVSIPKGGVGHRAIAAIRERITPRSPEQRVVEPDDEHWIWRYLADAGDLTNENTLQVVGIVAIWLLMLAFTFHGMSVCSRRFAAVLALLAIAMLVFTAIVVHSIVGMTLRREEHDPEELSDRWECGDQYHWRTVKVEKPVDWISGGSGVGALRFPLVAFAAGMMGGLLGIGGGIIMSPVLLEVGMHSEAVQATTAVFVFVSSSLATIQFAALGRHVWHYALWYSTITVVATIIGQYLCTVYVRRHKRYSMITLAIAGVLAFSLVALVAVGTVNLSADIQGGQPMGFTTTKLCGGSKRILTSDVTDSAVWPSDLPPHQR